MGLIHKWSFNAITALPFTPTEGVEQTESGSFFIKVARLRLCVSLNKNKGQDVDLGKYWHVMWGIVRCNSCEKTSLTIPYNVSSGAAIRIVKGLVLPVKRMVIAGGADGFDS